MMALASSGLKWGGLLGSSAVSGGALLAWAPGAMELIIIGVVVLLLFGNRLPSVMRSLGRGVVEFKKGVQGIEDGEEGQPPEGKNDGK